MNVTIIGTGYVGLVTGACLADAGNSVFCLDVDEKKINLLNENKIPIFEPGLEPVVKRNREAGRLRFSTDVAASVAHGELQLIAVGTPPGEDGSADLQHVVAAARAIGRHMQGYKVVVTKSTVPVGTADKVKLAIIQELKKRGTGSDFTVVANPEFLKEGAAVEDFMRPDRIIIGSDDDRAVALLRQLYACHPHLVHERGGEPRGSDRRRHRGSAARHRLGSAHRLPVPLRRRRFRRLVLSQGRESAAAQRRRGWAPLETARRRRGGQRGAEARARREDQKAFWFSCGEKNCALGTRLQGQHRRPARGPEPQSDRRSHAGGRERAGL